MAASDDLIPVNERLPVSGELVVVNTAHDDVLYASLVVSGDKTAWIRQNGEPVHDMVLAWRPLKPEPPVDPWTKCGDRWPERYKHVFVKGTYITCEGESRKFIAVAMLGTYEWVSLPEYRPLESKGYQVTHWRELPELPGDA